MDASIQAQITNLQKTVTHPRAAEVWTPEWISKLSELTPEQHAEIAQRYTIALATGHYDTKLKEIAVDLLLSEASATADAPTQVFGRLSGNEQADE